MAASCADCNIIWNNRDTVVCFRCGEAFHSKCCSDKKVLTTEIIDLIKKKTNTIRWFCRTCDEFSKEVYSELRELKQKMMETHQEQLEILKKLEEKYEATDNSSKASYSNVVKKAKSDPVILIKPKKDQRIKDTKDLLRRKVDPIEVPVNGLMNAAKGSVLVKCKNIDSVNTVREEIEKKMGKDYEVSIPVQKNPRIKILNVYDDQNTSEENFSNRIVMQNSNIIQNESEIKIIKIESRKTNVNSKNIIIEVNAVLYEKIMNEKYLNVFWKRCPVVEAIQIVRCYRCGEFGHISKANNTTCENKQSCPKCSLEHKIGECKSRYEKCSNCVKHNIHLNLNLNTDHPVWDKNCPVYQRKLRMKRRSINYTSK